MDVLFGWFFLLTTLIFSVPTFVFVILMPVLLPLGIIAGIVDIFVAIGEYKSK